MSYYVQIYVSQKFACGVSHLAGHTRGGPGGGTARPATYLFEEKNRRAVFDRSLSAALRYQERERGERRVDAGREKLPSHDTSDAAAIIHNETVTRFAMAQVFNSSHSAGASRRGRREKFSLESAEKRHTIRQGIIAQMLSY